MVWSLNLFFTFPIWFTAHDLRELFRDCLPVLPVCKAFVRFALGFFSDIYTSDLHKRIYVFACVVNNPMIASKH
jgi:hypothetical protein